MRALILTHSFRSQLLTREIDGKGKELAAGAPTPTRRKRVVDDEDDDDDDDDGENVWVTVNREQR